MNKQFNTIVGSYVTEEEGIYLIIPENKVEEAVTDLIRIGLANIKGWATPEELNKFREKGGELFKTETIDFEKAEEHLKSGKMNLLDVRKKSEFDEGHHPEAYNIAHTRLLDRLDDVPSGKPLMVHCKSGARAAVASAMLERADFSVTYIDDAVEPWLAKNDWDKEGIKA
jgi:hydroxyacylglutathione hydrolase